MCNSMFYFICLVSNVKGKDFQGALVLHGLCSLSTGWPKSNVPKLRAYCSASDHLIRKNFSGVWRDSQWFEEYLKISENGDYFFE